MQKMLVWGSLVLAACGGGGQKSEPATPGNGGAALGNSVPAETPPPTPKSDMQVAMDTMRDFRDQFCACKDANCAQKVSDDMTKWGQEMSKKYTDAQPKMSEAETKEMQQIGTQMGDCMVKAMQGGTPPNPGSNPCGGGP